MHYVSRDWDSYCYTFVVALYTVAVLLVVVLSDIC